MATLSSLGNILIVDSDESITDLLRLNLDSEGYKVTVVPHTAQVSLSSIRAYHLIIIDGSSHTPTGLELVEQVRAARGGDRAGIIYYSAYTSERTLIDALDAGADDCVCKPFSLREMLARIRAVMRRRVQLVPASDEEADNIDIVSVGTMMIDLAKKIIEIDGHPVALSATEFSILELLLRTPGSYMSRIEIFKTVWAGSTGANERIVDTNISRLRRKLGAYATCIASRQGMGYTFVSEQ